MQFYMMKNADCSWKKKLCLNYQKYKTFELSKFIFISKDKCEQHGRSAGREKRLELPLLFFGNRKKCPDFGGDALILFNIKLNFLFKMRALEGTLTWKRTFLKLVRILLLWESCKILFQKKSFLTIFISFLRPYLTYGDIIYYQPNSWNFYHKIEYIQYKAALE